MPVLREHGPYIHPSWLPKLLVGIDLSEWKIRFQAHHDGRTWERLDSNVEQTRYNLQHTEPLRRFAQQYEERGYQVTLEKQNEFRFSLAGATISGRIDLDVHAAAGCPYPVNDGIREGPLRRQPQRGHCRHRVGRRTQRIPGTTAPTYVTTFYPAKGNE